MTTFKREKPSQNLNAMFWGKYAVPKRFGNVQFSLVIPCYNEASGLQKLVQRCAEVSHGRAGEIILVDNGSSDATPEMLPDLIANHAQIRAIRVERNLGYGHGIMAGLQAARFDLLSWTHADLQTDPEDAYKAHQVFLKAHNPIYTFVKGKRIARPMKDRVFTFGMSLMESSMFGYFLSDINAQPTMFHRKFYDSWKGNTPDDFSLDLYVYLAAKRAGLSTRRVNVHFSEREFGESSWNIDYPSKIKFIRRTLDYSFKLKNRLSGL